MARFAGNVGFGVSMEKSPGFYVDVITEKAYFGDVISNARQGITSDKINDDFITENSISIVADSYASDNIFAIRYVDWAGTLWKVPSVEVQGVRLILRLGGVYDGPTTNIPDE